jgi:hypothetical protein
LHSSECRFTKKRNKATPYRYSRKNFLKIKRLRKNRKKVNSKRYSRHFSKRLKNLGFSGKEIDKNYKTDI